MLQEAGFDCQPSKAGHELVYERKVFDTDLYVFVYTTICRGEARRAGSDAIRVVGLLRKSDSGTMMYSSICKSVRVNRTGLIADILKRTKTRMRETWRKCLTNKNCNNCDAPMFLSKKGNPCCSKFCWVKK